MTTAITANAIAKLREWLKPGDTIYTILRHVSGPGMQRHISVVIFRDGQPCKRPLSENNKLYSEDLW